VFSVSTSGSLLTEYELPVSRHFGACEDAHLGLLSSYTAGMIVVSACGLYPGAR
jgi:hypothetical protein